jgi:tetratricopeptide (TPR) repeat protein
MTSMTTDREDSVGRSNTSLRALRQRQPSRVNPGEPLGRQELADLVNAHVEAATARPGALDANYIGKLERGVISWPGRHYRAALREVLGVRTDRELGLTRSRHAAPAAGTIAVPPETLALPGSGLSANSSALSEALTGFTGAAVALPRTTGARGLVDDERGPARETSEKSLDRASSSGIEPLDHTMALPPGLLKRPDDIADDKQASAMPLLNDLFIRAGRGEESKLFEMAQIIAMWATRLDREPGVSRRKFLENVSVAFTLAATAPLLNISDEDERMEVEAAILGSSRFSEPTLRYCEKSLDGLRKQGDVLGPQAAMQSALAHRQLAVSLGKMAPKSYRFRALSVAAELNQIVGWLCFNLGDYRGARHYYDEARSLAHDAHNVELVTYVLCTMGHLAVWEGKPRVGIDHAIAAQAWAAQAANPRAEAYAADIAARAFAADQEAGRCRTALETEQTALAALENGEGGLPLWYFYDESFYWATTSECALWLRDTDRALEAAATSLRLIDPSNLHNYAFTMLIRAEALLQKGEAEESSEIIGNVGTLVRANTTRRIGQKIVDLRSRADAALAKREG